MNQINILAPEMNYEVEEAFKILRTNLQFCGADKKVIDITSCTANEGKSTVALQLAISLAQSGKRTLLIDADIRNSVMTGYVDAVGQEFIGLTHVLSGQGKLNDAIQKTNIPNFYLIFSGPFPPNPSELLGSAEFSKAIETVREVFDYIIVDTAPLGMVIDSAVIAKNCDGSVLVLEASAISYRMAQDVKAQLERTGCPFLGVVLNKVDTHSLHSYYGHYGKYGRYGKKYGYGYGSYGQYGGDKKEGGQDQK